MMSVCFLARLLLCLPLHCLPVVWKHLTLSSHFMLIPLVWYLLVLGFSKVHILELITLYSFGGISYTRINCVYIYICIHIYIYMYTYTYTYMREREREGEFKEFAHTMTSKWMIQWFSILENISNFFCHVHTVSFHLIGSVTNPVKSCTISGQLSLEGIYLGSEHEDLHSFSIMVVSSMV